MAALTCEFPSPSCMGVHDVGCIDLMHKNLLVRIFYPSAEAIGNPSTKWLPSAVYARGYVDMMKVLLPSVPMPPADSLLSKLLLLKKLL